MTAASAVIDASALIRASVEKTDDARHWIELIDGGQTHGFVPDLFYAEVANALSLYVRAGYLQVELAVELCRRVVDLPLISRSLRELSPAALALSLERGLTVYDAAYLALAEAAEAVLVTADRSLADAATRPALLD